MKVAIVGAGLSKHAGYPLQKELAELIVIQLKKEKVNQEIISFLESTQDIELLLTHVDLNLSNGHRGIFSNLDLVELGKIRRKLKEVLIGYMELIESTSKPTKELKEFCESYLTDGDCIISLNYDLILEKTLIESQLWTLRDGYGFIYKRFGDLPKEQIEFFSSVAASRRFIYKLHGSINWAWIKQGDKEFLDIHVPLFMNFASSSTVFFGPPGKIKVDEIFIEPSYVKRFENFLIETWKEAFSQVEKADEIIIIGCNLNEADTPFRLFLSSALLGKKIPIKIVNFVNDLDTKIKFEDKYKKLFGINYIPCWDKFEDWIK